jgi:hypothetical protein
MHGDNMRKERKRLLHHDPALSYIWMWVNDLLSPQELSKEPEQLLDVIVSLCPSSPIRLLPLVHGSMEAHSHYNYRAVGHFNPSSLYPA